MTQNTSGKAKEQKIKLLLEETASGSPVKIKTALDSLQVYGDHRVIQPLLEIVRLDPASEGNLLILSFLSDLKDSASRPEIMRCLNDQMFAACRREIMGTIWNSPLDYSDYLSDFVRIAVHYDFMHTLESLTVIENLEGPFEEKDILESQLLLKDYLEGKFEKSREKDQLISEIALLIKDFDRNQSELDDWQDA